MPNSPSSSSFQMVGARAALFGGPTADVIELQVRAIEEAIKRVPALAFDLSKALVETVCKTVLTDKGIAPDTKWDCPTLFKETLKQISLLPPDFPEPSKATESIVKTMRGLLQSVQGLCELRNKFGLASHGPDLLAARLGFRQAILAAQSADTIFSFLYLMHRDALNQAPGDRLYYEDHQDFNETIDRENDPVQIGTITLAPSRVLFHVDREAYKAGLLDFIAERAGGLDDNGGGGDGGS